MRIGVLGGSGFIGRHLVSALQARGDEVVITSLRDPWSAASQCARCDVIVNLAGEPLAQRWNKAVKEKIVRSRVEQPRAFLTALGSTDHQAKAYISASAIGYYGTSETATFTEHSPPGNDFLAHVCADWERETNHAADLGMRVAIVRTGVALGKDGGALAKILPPFRAGAGGIVGTGRQWLSWVHVDDAVGVYLMAIDGTSGAVNATAPKPVTNAEFTHALGAAVHRPTVLPMPTFALRLALGEGADILLTGQRVLPERTQAEGYRFRFPTLSDALPVLV